MGRIESKANSNHNSFDIINMYFDEWKYRHENFWKRLVQFTVITFFTTSFPITFRVFDNLELPDIPMIIFPIVGAVLAFLSMFFCLSEYSRLDALGNTINALIENQYGGSFLKKPLSFGKFGKILGCRIGILFPIVITVLQLVLVYFVLWLILSNRF